MARYQTDRTLEGYPDPGCPWDGIDAPWALECSTLDATTIYRIGWNTAAEEVEVLCIVALGGTYDGGKGEAPPLCDALHEIGTGALAVLDGSRPLIPPVFGPVQREAWAETNRGETERSDAPPVWSRIPTTTGGETSNTDTIVPPGLPPTEPSGLPPVPLPASGFAILTAIGLLVLWQAAGRAMRD